MSGKCVSDPHDFTAQFIVVRKSLDDSKTILCLECLVIILLLKIYNKSQKNVYPRCGMTTPIDDNR